MTDNGDSRMDSLLGESSCSVGNPVIYKENQIYDF